MYHALSNTWNSNHLCISLFCSRKIWDLTKLMLKQNKNPENQNFQGFLEAQTGFEPVRTGVADHCLTAWLLRRKYHVMTPTGIEPVLPP